MSTDQLLIEGLEALREEAEEAIPRLVELAQLLEQWSTRINLTGHRGEEAIARNLVLGAAALLAQLPTFETLADLGSGAGFPGFPIAILRPDAHVVLVEARQRRHHFQRAVVRALALENVELVRDRIEDAAPRRSDVVVAQALARPDAALALMRDWATPEGLLAIPGSERPPAVDPSQWRGEVRRYQVPLGGPDRTLWLGRPR